MKLLAVVLLLVFALAVSAQWGMEGGFGEMGMGMPPPPPPPPPMEGGFGGFGGPGFGGWRRRK